MPVGQYTSRPYSSFRAGKLNSTNQSPMSPTSIKRQPNYLSPTTSSSHSITSSSFTNQRLQPFRSSLYGTKSTCGNAARDDYRRGIGFPSSPDIKPLTPKTCRRIEFYTETVNATKNKNLSPSVNPAPMNYNNNDSNKQYLRSRSNNNNITSGIRHQQTNDRNNQNNHSFRRGNVPSRPVQQNLIRAKSPAVSSSGASDESIVPKYNNSAGYLGRPSNSFINGCSQKRAYNIVKVPKENVPNTNNNNGSHTGDYSYRSSLKPPPSPVVRNAVKPTVLANKGPVLYQQHKKKYKEDNKPSSSSSPQLNGGHNRRQYHPLPVGGGDGAGSSGSTLNSSASGSNSGGSQGSPQTKKAFSSKFPNGLPFEDEFYHRRSPSRSSSNYSTNINNNYVGDADAAPTSTKFNENDEDVDGNDDDDEFTRKPSNEPLYVDFSKPITRQRRKNDSESNGTSNNYHYQRQQKQFQRNHSSNHHQQYSHTTRAQATGVPPSHLHYTHTHQQQQQRRTNGYIYEYVGQKESRGSFRKKNLVGGGPSCCLHDNANNNNNNDSVRRGSDDANVFDNYHHQQNGRPRGKDAPNEGKRTTDVYRTVVSWVPKCPQHPKTYSTYGVDRSHAQTGRGDFLESTNCEYIYDRSSRRRKERSKRSHRKSPTSGRRAHKYRYRDDASHSSSRRRHRDRAKEKDNRTTPSKAYKLTITHLLKKKILIQVNYNTSIKEEDIS